MLHCDNISPQYIEPTYQADTMDVRSLCLATLMSCEASGYDIKKALERGSSAGMIDASFGSIYPALARLADEGLIEVRSEAAGAKGRADRKVYAITELGRASFLKALAAPLPDDKFRSPFLFAMLFADELPRERVRSAIDQQIMQLEKKLAYLADEMHGDGTGATFVRDLSEVSLKAALDFLRRHRSRVENAAGRKSVRPARTVTSRRSKNIYTVSAVAGE